MIEEWVSVPGFETYEASNLGNIRSIDRVNMAGRLVKGIGLKMYVNYGGYLNVKLYSSNGIRNTTAHRVIAISWLPNPDNKETVNHKNGIKTDNSIENLEWATRSEQSIHAYKNNLKKPLRGTIHPKAKLNDEKVREIRSLYSGGYKNQNELAAIYDVDQRKIHGVIHRKYWSHVD